MNTVDDHTGISESIQFWLWLSIAIFVILSFILFTFHFFNNLQHYRQAQEFGHPFMIAQLTTAGAVRQSADQKSAEA